MAAQVGPCFSKPGRKVDCAIFPHAAKHSNQHRFITNIIEEPGARQPAKPLTKRELAGFLGMGERFIELEVRRGCLRAVRLSNRDWIDQQVEQLSSSLCDLASAHGFS